MKNVPIGGGTQLTTQKKKMKKKLFIFFTLFIALFAMSTSAFAQLANGTYYIKNVATGKYFAAGSSWGTHAIIDNHGIDVKLTAMQEGKYTIDTQISNGNGSGKNFLAIIDGNLYTDGTTFSWTFKPTNTTDGTQAFYIQNGEKNISTQKDNIDLILSTDNDDYAKWVFISESDRIADLANATTKTGKDATWLIKGHNFGQNDTRNDAWQGGIKLNQNAQAFAFANFNTEQYDTDFDVNQTINVPNGKYVLEVQGYYRNGNVENSAAAHLNDTENLLAIIYANSVEATLPSIYVDAGKVDVGITTNGINGKFPNGQDDASAFFSAGAYNLTLDPVVVSDGTLKIGVKKTEKVDKDWACFDNFRLTYYGLKVSDRATSTTSPAEVAADTWYAFDVPVAGDYTITPSAGTIYYTQNGELFPSEITTSTTEATLLTLAQGKLYVKASEATTISFFTHELGTDITNSYLKNPGFETGDLTGWTTENSTDTGVKDATDATYKAQGSEGSKLFNTWPDGKALTQNIGKLNAGVYELSAMLATGDNPDSKGTVYLTVNDTKSAGMVSRNGNKQVMHKETLTFVSDGKTETTIGAVGIEIGNGHWWYKADDFKLTFVDNTNNLFKVLTNVIANTEPWTTSGEYVNKYNEYKGLTETSAQADILSAINYLKTNYDNYAWENASVEHPYLMSNVIAKAELDDNTPWLGSGRLTKPNTDHWSGGKKTVFVQNSGEYARKQAITVPYSGKYLLKTAVRTFTDNAFANIKMGDVVSSTNTKTGNKGGNVNIDGTEGTNNRANGNAGYGWTFNNLNYWCDADNTKTEIAIQLSTVSDDFSRGDEAQASGMFLYYVGQNYDQVENGVHYYYGKWEADDVVSELTNETPILDLTKATINGTVAIKATNKNGLVYTNSVNSLSGIDNNIVKDGTCANLVLTDGYPFTTTKKFDATKAKYTMTAIADGKFGTLVLPFAAQLPTDGKAYALDGELNVIDGELVGSAVTSLAANKPVLVTKAGEYTASAVSVAETSASQINTNGNLTGVYQNTEAPVGSYVLQNHTATQGVAFYLVGEVKPTVKPFRAFIPTQDAKVKAIKVVFDGEATGIKEITSDNTKAEIFDLSGRRVAKAQKGVYIINGKKVIKK